MLNKMREQVCEKLINEVFQKCYFISTHSKCDVFFRYAAHVHCYEVDYSLNGWDINDNPVPINTCTEVNPENLQDTLYQLEQLWKVINSKPEVQINE